MGAGKLLTRLEIRLAGPTLLSHWVRVRRHDRCARVGFTIRLSGTLETPIYDTLISMLSLVLSAALALPLIANDDQEVETLPPAVEQALKELDNALETKIEGMIVSVIFRHKELVHPAVIERFASALKHRKPGVRKTALAALRFMDHEDALLALIKFCEKDKRIRIDRDQLERTLRAIGQHADERSRELFTKPPYESVDETVIRARIRSLGRLRSKQSVIDLMAMYETKEEWKPVDFLDDFRLSLMVLTGVDRGTNPADWKRWWKDAEEDLVIPERLPKLELLDLREWCNYWELPLPEGVETPEDGEHRRRGKK